MATHAHDSHGSAHAPSLPAPPAREGTRVKGVYHHLDSLLTGIQRLRRAGLEGFVVQSPLPRHEIEEAMYGGKPAPVRWWTLTGGLTGITTGLLITSLTMSAWPMINPGGKPVVSLVPFVVIMFECTILFASLATGVGMFFHAGLPGAFLDRSLKDPRMTDASFGITFTAARPADVERITELLRSSGAIEVTTGSDTFYEVPNA
jgi:hypothetical protein